MRYAVNQERQKNLAESFRLMHRAPPTLLLPNAWDAMSARVFEAAGFDAVATTSGGLAWALGYADGEQTPWPDVVAATERIVRAVRIPVTVDIESGYGETPNQVADNVGDIIRAGAVGVNIEDSTSHADQPVRSLEDASERIRTARATAKAAGVPLVINARIDLYLKRVGDEAQRFAETIRRAQAYVAAGADCIFPFGLVDMKRLTELAHAVKVPLNVVGRTGGPSLAELERAGIARISTAAGPALAALSLVQKIAAELRATGRFDILKSTATRADAQALFAPRPN